MNSSLLKIHIPRGEESAMGPGKADLLDAIEQAGSISGAARAMGMSYKRAWDLVDTMNRCFRQPLVETATGGSHGGGAEVTDFGRDILMRYRAIQHTASASVEDEVQALIALLA
ncbi:MAG: winged helix-turn-helix domain-containing protein [Methylobacillus sp.]|jgi:molybdate transport system regulatory protein|nr:winged helix-turn-helix domain-containing protein [Methylobacillus sp.]